MFPPVSVHKGLLYPGNQFDLQVPCLLTCTGSEVAQGMQDVAAHLEVHDLHAGRLAKVSVAELEYGM